MTALFWCLVAGAIYIAGIMLTRYVLIRIYGDTDYPWGRTSGDINEIHADFFAALWIICVPISGPIWLFRQLHRYTKSAAIEANKLNKSEKGKKVRG